MILPSYWLIAAQSYIFSHIIMSHRCWDTSIFTHELTWHLRSITCLLIVDTKCMEIKQCRWRFETVFLSHLQSRGLPIYVCIINCHLCQVLSSLQLIDASIIKSNFLDFFVRNLLTKKLHQLILNLSSSEWARHMNFCFWVLET